jgi:histidinol phosphatase-like PHP family hydrolase
MGAGISVDALKKTKIPSLSRNEQQFPFDWASVHEPNEINYARSTSLNYAMLLHHVQHVS